MGYPIGGYVELQDGAIGGLNGVSLDVLRGAFGGF